MSKNHMTLNKQLHPLIVMIVAATLLSLTGPLFADQAKPARSLEADFVMTRKMAVLKDAVRSTGRLVLGGPGRLRWETRTPAKSILIINGDAGWLHYPELGVTKSFDLSQEPVMKVIAEHLIAFSTGSLDTIGDLYAVEEQPDGTKRLLPKRPEVKEIFTEMRVAANPEGVVSKVTLLSTNGDVTEIAFSNVRTDPVLRDAMFARPAER